MGKTAGLFKKMGQFISRASRARVTDARRKVNFSEQRLEFVPMRARGICYFAPMISRCEILSTKNPHPSV